MSDFIKLAQTIPLDQAKKIQRFQDISEDDVATLQSMEFLRLEDIEFAQDTMELVLLKTMHRNYKLSTEPNVMHDFDTFMVTLENYVTANDHASVVDYIVTAHTTKEEPKVDWTKIMQEKFEGLDKSKWH